MTDTGSQERENFDLVAARLEAAPPMFFLPKDDLLPTLVPAIGSADSLDCMMGFFASSSFAEIAPGLASFLRRSDNPMRLIMSPFVSPGDREALELGADAGMIVESRLAETLPDADALAAHTLSCLAWLVRQGRLEIKIALLKGGLFHPKVWLLNLGGRRAAFHGSSNLTGAALSRNKEQVALARGWMDDVQDVTERRIRTEFQDIWEGDDPDVIVVPLPKAVEQKLLKEYGSGSMPEESHAEALWDRAVGRPTVEGVEHLDALAPRFAIPDWLEWRGGPFGHQGKAVDAWLAANGRGVLAMATGSGKTLTSLVACHELRDKVGPLLVVVAAPYVPLVTQWCEEVRLFGVEPRDMTAAGGPDGRRLDIAEAIRSIKLGRTEVEVLVVSHDTLINPAFQKQVAKVECAKLLIADEMHNLGSHSFLSSPPDAFDYRLGLSATPVRQYDPEGTDKLLSFFGDVCFEFLLDDAIGICLVPYDYYVHEVELTAEEMEEFRDLSEQIRKLGWKIEQNASDPHLDNLLRKRRLVIERAQGKIAALAALIDDEGPRALRYELVYATDKDPTQLDEVNALLSSRGVLFHQLTAEETRRRAVSSQILLSYQRAELQVLTAKRVLDEGVNVPQIKRAFILASTTVERQWVQRRGRILRTCEAIGKTHGVIHDFVALPPGDLVLDEDAKRLVKGELKRVEEFARLARNYGAADGPLSVLRRMQDAIYEI